MDLRHLQLRNVNDRLLNLSLARGLLCSRSRGLSALCGSCRILLLLFDPLGFFKSLFFLILFEGLFFKLFLSLFSLFGEEREDLFALGLIKHAEL